MPKKISFENQTFDIIFLDPPFNKGLIKICCEQIAKQKLAKESTLIYIEAEKSLNPLPIPNAWKIIKSKTAGDLAYYLITG